MEVDGGRVNCALAPGDWWSEHRLGQRQDLTPFRETMKLELAEDQLVVQRHLESPFASRTERDIDHDGRPVPENLSRQTDGLLQVVSGNAIFDRDAVLGINHVASVSAIPTDASQVGILKACRELEPIAEEPIHADMPEPDERDRTVRAPTSQNPDDSDEPR